MKKKQLTKIFRAGAAVLLAGALCGCSVKFGTRKQPKPDKVVAHATAGEGYEDMQITYGRFYQEYWYVLANSDIHDDTNLDEYVDAQVKAQRGKAIQYLINEQVIMKKAKELGVYELTAEEQAEVDKEYEEMIAEAIAAQGDAAVTEMAIAQLEAAGDDATEIALPELSDEEKQALGKERYEKLLEECGMTYDDLRWWAESSRIADKVYDAVVAEVTQADVDAGYLELIEEAKSIYASSISGYVQYGYSDVWLPDGSRLIKHILLGFDDDTKQQIYTLRQEGKTEDADKLREEAAAALEEKRLEVEQKLDDGANIADLISEYSADKEGSEASPDGYLVLPNDTRYMSEFTAGAFVPENKGDRTVAVTDYGVHIMIYADDAKVSEADKPTYENIVRSKLQNEKYSAAVEAWLAEYAYEIDYETLRIDDPNAASEE